MSAVSSTSLTNVHLKNVAQYWDSMTCMYLKYMSTFQAGLFSSPNDSDAFKSSNLRVAERAGIRIGDRVLDAGCGIAAPSIDIAKNLSDVTIDAVTISGVQAKIAKQRVREAQLEDRIRILHADYHLLPYADNYFDSVIFLESFGYTQDRVALLNEITRVLRPGGILYIKDVFRFEQISLHEARELEEFNSIYVYQTSTVSATVSDVENCGLSVLESLDITRIVDRRHVVRSMFDGPSRDPNELTEFGRAHYRGFNCLPIIFHEIKARN